MTVLTPRQQEIISNISPGADQVQLGALMEQALSGVLPPGSVTVGEIALTTGSLILGAASVGSALDVSGDTKILIGNGTTGAMFVLGGDVTMTNGGVVTIGTLAHALSVDHMIDVEDSQVGGAANGSVIKKQLVAGEAYTVTTAGVMVKMYGEATATVPSGEFCALYASLKGLHTDPGNNTSIISAHVHASNTTVVHAGLWVYGDVTNGVKASGSTLTNLLDISEATAVANVISLPALSTAPCSGQTTADYTFTKTVKLSILIGGAQYYLIADTTA